MRFRLRELEDLPYLPKMLREFMTDCLREAMEFFRAYDPVFPGLDNLINKSQVKKIIDLCSGSGGPVIRYFKSRPDNFCEVVLTDLYPQSEGSKLKGVTYLAEPISSLQIPSNLRGVHTLFTSLHHFTEEEVKTIINQVVAKGDPFAAFEITSKSPLSILAVICSPIWVLLLTPLILFKRRQNRWQRFVLTYLCPIVPILVLLDGLISCYNSHDRQTLQRITDNFDSYIWDISSTHGVFLIPIVSVTGHLKENGKYEDSSSSS